MRIEGWRRIGRLALGLTSGAVLALSGTTTAHAQSCSGGNVSFNGVFGDDTAALEDAMQRATDRGVTLTIAPGNYIINRPRSQVSTNDSGVRVTLRKSFNVIATGATFDVGPRIEGDAININTTGSSFNTSSCGNTSKANVDWDGGFFDLRDMKVSTSVPIQNITTDRPTSNSATADALSLRGATDRNGTRTQKLGVVFIDNLEVRGSNGSWRTAGGDSGVFVSGATSATIEDSEFYGMRDAGIYLSADDKNSSFGRNYMVRRVRVEDSYDGITSKRGADNITYTDNVIVDTVVGLSIKAIRNNLYAIDITMTGNTLRRCVRCILLENGSDATIDNNDFFSIGDPVAGDNTPVNAGGPQYEAIAFEGFRGSNFARNNLLQSVSGSRAAQVETWAIVRRSFGSRATIAPSTSGNTFQGGWDRVNTTD